MRNKITIVKNCDIAEDINIHCQRINMKSDLCFVRLKALDVHYNRVLDVFLIL